MQRRHVIISGTGRAGTTFLVQLFTALGLDTGFADPGAAIFPNCDAGMETDIRDVGAPYIIKTPWLCDYVDEVLDRGDITIERAFVPVRDLFSAAESRRDVARRSDAAEYPKRIPGALWHTDVPAEQERVLTNQLYKLIFALAKHDVPLTLLYFPRIVHDADYLYGKVESVVTAIPLETFREIHGQIAQPQLVHDFVSRQNTTVGNPHGR